MMFLMKGIDMAKPNLTSIAMILLLAVGFLVTPVLCSAQTLINGAGATFPYPIYSKWFNEYRKLHPDVQINYQSIGSGGGIRQVTEGTVDFGATPIPSPASTSARSRSGTILRLHPPIQS
jgi:phosphate transport system substrate-binding protein